jgi:hypothetical protein
VEACVDWQNLSASQVATVTAECSSSFDGTLVSACPTSNEVGCCTAVTSGYTQTICYYCGSASPYQEACTASSGTWTAGSGGPATCATTEGDAG